MSFPDKSMSSQYVTETQTTRLFVEPREGEQLSSLLKRCIPQVQTKRALAYNRLDDALRKSSGMPRSRPLTSAPRTKLHSDIPICTAPIDDDYGTVCAHVTEDLKVCSEAILELRCVLSEHTRVESRLRETEPNEVSMAIKWLDTLQDLEENKLMATVSKHVLSRSKFGSESGKGGLVQPQSFEEIKAKVAQYARDVSEVDETINELLQEMREYFLEQEE